MMKKVVVATFLLLLFSGVAYADSFQILHKNAPVGEVYVAHAPIEVLDADGEILFKGRTDAYGRFRVDFTQHKSCQAVVTYQDRKHRVRLAIDGSREMKKIYLKT